MFKSKACRHRQTFLPYVGVVSVSEEAVIGLVGKYTELHDTYLSVVKALLHASLQCQRHLTVKWIDSSALDKAKKDKACVLLGRHGGKNKRSSVFV